LPDEPLSNREILGKFEDQRTAQRAVDDRITALAQSTVTVDSWQRENGHIQKDIAEVDVHCEERHQIAMGALDDLRRSLSEVKTAVEKRSDITWQRVLGVSSIVAVLVAAWYTAVHQGVH
jgi:hypothetical protein